MNIICEKLPYASGHSLRRDGFTLLELLVVIAIIGLLAAILFPAITRSLANSKTTKCLSNLRQIGIAQTSYRADHDNRYTPKYIPGNPTSQVWQIHLKPYIGSGDRSDVAAVLNCPVVKNLNENQTSYALNAYIEWSQWNYRAAAVERPSEIILAGDCLAGNTDIMREADLNRSWGLPAFRHGADDLANMLFCDGSVKSMYYEELALDAGHWKWW